MHREISKDLKLLFRWQRLFLMASNQRKSEGSNVCRSITSFPGLTNSVDVASLLQNGPLNILNKIVLNSFTLNSRIYLSSSQLHPVVVGRAEAYKFWPEVENTLNFRYTTKKQNWCGCRKVVFWEINQIRRNQIFDSPPAQAIKKRLKIAGGPM